MARQIAGEQVGGTESDCFAWLTRVEKQHHRKQLLNSTKFASSSYQPNFTTSRKDQESVTHLLAGCSSLAQTRQNAALKYFELLRDLDKVLAVLAPWYSPDTIQTNVR